MSFSLINQLGLFLCSKLQNILDISFIPDIDVGQGMWGAVFARSIAISLFLSAFSLQHFDTPSNIQLPPYDVTLFNCNRHMLCNDFVLLMFVLSFPIYSRCIFMPAIVCLKTTNLIVAENRLKSKVSKVIEISNKFWYPNQYTSPTSSHTSLDKTLELLLRTCTERVTGK